MSPAIECTRPKKASPPAREGRRNRLSCANRNPEPPAKSFTFRRSATARGAGEPARRSRASRWLGDRTLANGTSAWRWRSPPASLVLDLDVPQVVGEVAPAVAKHGADRARAVRPRQ